MKIDQINIYSILLPFRGDFSISRLKGLSSKPTVVEVLACGGGVRGYGEGVPVEFVTGETPETVLKSLGAFLSNGSFPWDLDDVSQVWSFVDSLPEEKYHNAAICAVETALLDALGRFEKKPVIDYLPHEYLAEKVYYGAPVTLGTRERIAGICASIRALGIKKVRIKMGNDFDQNKMLLETVDSILGSDCELRVDPNGVWDRDQALRHLPLIEKYGVRIVEEPMEREESGFEEFAGLLRSRGITMMACESAPTLRDIKRIVREGYYRMINVKLSRSGGFRRALAMIDEIRKSGLPFQIGCTLGESGILSAAGRALSLVSGDAVTHDGSYDRFLLKENTTVKAVSFGPGGEAGPLDGPGLGVEVKKDALLRLAGSSRRMTLNRP